MGRNSNSSWATRPRAPIPYKLLDSPAYLEISHAARHAFWRLVVELGRHKGGENGRLVCTYRDFEEHGIPVNLIARAIRELVAVGLVEVTRPGAAGNAEHRQPALYRLTYAGRAGTKEIDGTHDYERFAPTREQAAAVVKAAAKPVNNRSAALGRKGAAVAQIQKSALKSKGEVALKSEGKNGKVPLSELRAQSPPSDLRALSTSPPMGASGRRPNTGRPQRR